MTIIIFILIMVVLSPYMVWHFRYLSFVSKLVTLLESKHPKIWQSLLNNKLAWTFLNYYGFNKRNWPIPIPGEFTGIIEVSLNSVGPYAQLRAIKFLEQQNIEDSETVLLVANMRKTMQNTIRFTKICFGIIGLSILIAVIYIYTR